MQKSKVKVGEEYAAGYLNARVRVLEIKPGWDGIKVEVLDGRKSAWKPGTIRQLGGADMSRTWAEQEALDREHDIVRVQAEALNEKARALGVIGPDTNVFWSNGARIWSRINDNDLIALIERAHDLMTVADRPPAATPSEDEDPFAGLLSGAR